MLRIGLTGGIGAGKSSVSARLAEHGAVVVDADRISREVVEPGTDGLAAIVAEFGADILGPAGSLDRPKLGSIVFSDDTARAKLNAIVHPRVARRREELVAASSPEAVVVEDIPLLVENDLAPHFHLVLVVEAPEEIRVARLESTRDMAPDTARARIAAQATDAQRRQVADIVIDNSDDLATLNSTVDTLWRDRIAPYARNLADGRCPQAPPEAVSSDPQWTAQFVRAERRLRAWLGEKAVRIDHIGPGGDDTDVLDIELSVHAFEDAAPVAEAGWISASPASDAKVGDTRLYCSADPGLPARLLVRLIG